MDGKRDPYAGMADVYDEMARDRQVREAYRYWREPLLPCASERKLEIRTLVDLMCGTGNTTIPWTRRAGWRVIGVDRSAALRVLRAEPQWTIGGKTVRRVFVLEKRSRILGTAYPGFPRNGLTHPKV